MKSLGLTAVVTGLSPLRRGTVQVPEHTEVGREISEISDKKNPSEVRLTTTTSGEIQEAPPVLCSSPSESKKYLNETSST